VNEHFARQLHKLLRRDDMIWVHDYHLIPMARFLRQMAAPAGLVFFCTFRGLGQMLRGNGGGGRLYIVGIHDQGAFKLLGRARELRQDEHAGVIRRLCRNIFLGDEVHTVAQGRDEAANEAEGRAFDGALDEARFPGDAGLDRLSGIGATRRRAGLGGIAALVP
jgi:Glycosyltransferase family 20